MNKVAQAQLNANFMEAMGSEVKRAELQKEMLTYIKRRVRETGFAGLILYKQDLTNFDVQRDVGTDTFYYIADIEPDSAAFEMNFRGEPTGVYVRAPRYIVPFAKITTERMQKQIDELRVYRMPIVEVIQRNQVKDIEEAEDRKFINLCHTAVANSGQSIDDGAASVLSKLALTRLFNLIDGQELRTVTMLMNNVTFNDILSQDATQFGDDLTSKVTQDGWAEDKFLGKRLIVTIKSGIVGNNEVFTFTSQEYLGHFLVMGSMEFYIRQYWDLLQWQSKEVIGMNIANIKAIARYRYSTGTSNATTIVERTTNP